MKWEPKATYATLQQVERPPRKRKEPGQHFQIAPGPRLNESKLPVRQKR